MYKSIVYRRSPVALQEALISMRAAGRAWLREGRAFRRLRHDVERSQWLDEVDLVDYRKSQLRRVLEIAIKNVRFYSDVAEGGDPLRTDPLDALLEFPLLDKKNVREAGSRIIADNASKPLFSASTSGTTGAPLTLLQDLAAINRENAFIWRQLKWAGLKPGGRRAWIRGDMVVPSAQHEPPFWRMNCTERMLMFSSYHLAEHNGAAYIAALTKFDPQVIQAYPSSIAFLAVWLESVGKVYGGASLCGIVTSSETLDEDTRALIESRFGCRVFDWYGQSERVAAIGTCEHGSKHVISDYSFVEFLPAEDGMCEIVGTGFNNLALPLIRYRTGDLVKLAADADLCSCGRNFPLVQYVQGRTEEVVKLPDGRRIGRLDHIFKGVVGVIEAQIRQDALERIDILVVTGGGYGQQIERRLLANARERLGNEIEIRIVKVDTIPRTNNGKFRGVICNV